MQQHYRSQKIGTLKSEPALTVEVKHMHFISTDVAVPGLNRDFAYSLPLLLPSKSLLREFLLTV